MAGSFLLNVDIVLLYFVALFESPVRDHESVFTCLVFGIRFTESQSMDVVSNEANSTTDHWSIVRQLLTLHEVRVQESVLRDATVSGESGACLLNGHVEFLLLRNIESDPKLRDLLFHWVNILSLEVFVNSNGGFSEVWGINELMEGHEEGAIIFRLVSCLLFQSRGPNRVSIRPWTIVSLICPGVSDFG